MNLFAREHNGEISEWVPRSGYAILKFYSNVDARKFKESKSKVYFGERQLQIFTWKAKPTVQSLENVRRQRSYSCPRRTPTNLGNLNYLVFVLCSSAVLLRFFPFKN